MTYQWSFVIAAYAVTALGTAFVLWQSWHSMRAAERRVDAMTRSQDV
ncbi:MAG: heme exporter protein CcmD [Sphingopyxis sp.]